MPATTYLANKLLEHQVGKAAYPMPTVYVGMSDGTSEPSGGSYARVATSPATWSTATNGVISNAQPITFPLATADWLAGANLTKGQLWDAASGGNKLAEGDITVPKNALMGDTPSITTGQLSITIS
jgi:hypothetical protein